MITSLAQQHRLKLRTQTEVLYCRAAEPSSARQPNRGSPGYTSSSPGIVQNRLNRQHSKPSSRRATRHQQHSPSELYLPVRQRSSSRWQNTKPTHEKDLAASEPCPLPTAAALQTRERSTTQCPSTATHLPSCPTAPTARSAQHRFTSEPRPQSLHQKNTSRLAFKRTALVL